MLIRRLSIVVVALVALFAGCAVTPDDERIDSGRPLVYTSFFPIESIAQQIAGESAEVRSFMPLGQDPHLWEPTANDIKKLSQADLLIINGANMEPWVDQVREAVPRVPILNLGDYVDLITYRGAAALGEFQFMATADLDADKTYTIEFGHTHEPNMRMALVPVHGDQSEAELVRAGRDALAEFGTDVEQEAHVVVKPNQAYSVAMGHESGEVTFSVPFSGRWAFVSDRVSQEILSYTIFDGDDELALVPVIDGGSAHTDKVTFDPHSWLSTSNAKRYANAIVAELVKLAPDDEIGLKNRKRDFVTDVSALEGEYQKKFGESTRKDFVVAHQAFAYIARDFGLTQFPIQGFTANEAPSLRSLVNIIRYVRQTGLHTIFYEHGTESKIADVVAQEVQGLSKPLISMEHITAADATRGYVELMRMNLSNIYESLQKS
ncbi:Probable zinc transport system zinc-binding lipoprotein AdcA precursor [Arcanobacterium haemolyticum]|uniref:metal ABC transporter solute-binding protein, Zn/Mn family n=1 Tax=Arcanobacterium haemolyticum TaxID=28264 RepID=UPI000D885491|nr:zinc ABC transporter substrate-binding protein [Arcanobacterium haemolyticum]SPT74490.1 Probable zinc transport system zinc-binding lipoprotein AdcA precursor [Arcanobacterium haemolyticum]